MSEDPLLLLTKLMAKARENPDDMTNLMAKEQLELYLAFGFGASKNGYNLKFLADILILDKLDMMSLQGKRADQVVEMAKALQTPLGIDTGLQPDDGSRRRRR